MRSLALGLAVVTGCNLVFHADPGPGLADAAVPDGDASPPPVCTPGAAPALRTPPQLLAGKRCTHYTQSRAAGIATAVCAGKLVQGPLDSDQLEDMPITIPNGRVVTAARIAPEGARLYARTRDEAAIELPRLDVFVRQNGGWQFEASTGLTATSGADLFEFSSPTPEPFPTILVAHGPPTVVEEWADANNDGNWIMLRSYDASHFGIGAMGQPSLTADGKRLVFFGNDVGSVVVTVFHAERGDVVLPFPRAATALVTGVPGPQYPYLRDDCGRLYVANVDTTTFTSQ